MQAANRGRGRGRFQPGPASGHRRRPGHLPRSQGHLSPDSADERADQARRSNEGAHVGALRRSGHPRGATLRAPVVSPGIRPASERSQVETVPTPGHTQGAAASVPLVPLLSLSVWSDVIRGRVLRGLSPCAHAGSLRDGSGVGGRQHGPDHDSTVCSWRLPELKAAEPRE